MRRHRGLLPVTFEEYSLQAYQEIKTQKETTYSADILYKNIVITTICVTVFDDHRRKDKVILLREPSEEHVDNMLDLCLEIIRYTKHIHDFQKPILFERYCQSNMKDPVKIVYAFFKLLCELNETFDHCCNAVAYSVRVMNCKRNSLLSCSQYATTDSYELIPACLSMREVHLHKNAYAWYAMDVPVKKRKCKLDIHQFRFLISYAYRTTIFQCTSFGKVNKF